MSPYPPLAFSTPRRGVRYIVTRCVKKGLNRQRNDKDFGKAVFIISSILEVITEALLWKNGDYLI